MAVARKRAPTGEGAMQDASRKHETPRSAQTHPIPHSKRAGSAGPSTATRTAPAQFAYFTEHPYGCVFATATGRPAARSASALRTYCVAAGMSAGSALGLESIAPA